MVNLYTEDAWQPRGTGEVQASSTQDECDGVGGQNRNEPELAGANRVALIAALIIGFLVFRFGMHGKFGRIGSAKREATREPWVSIRDRPAPEKSIAVFAL